MFKVVFLNIFITFTVLYFPNITFSNNFQWRQFILNNIFLNKNIKNFLSLKTIVQVHWFLMILLMLLLYNLISLIPRVMSFTVFLLIPIFCSLWFFSVINYLGLHSRRDSYILKFYPLKLPYIISPAIIWIEVISYLVRPVSLAARLFANMIAGHILVHIISGYAQFFILQGFFILALNTIILLSILNFMEYFVAVVQSFLFIFIGSIYYKDNL